MTVRIVILADIHSNLEAFQAVLRHAGTGGPIDRLWCLGDIVGYGPDPMACIELLRSYPHHMVVGNHDAAACGRTATAGCTRIMRLADLAAPSTHTLALRANACSSCTFPLPRYVLGCGRRRGWTRCPTTSAPAVVASADSSSSRSSASPSVQSATRTARSSEASPSWLSARG